MNLRRTAPLVALLALGACKVGPDYEAPSPEKQAVPLAASETADATSAGLLSGKPVVLEWWRTLRDEKLDALVLEVVAENLDLKTASARVREARGLRGIAASPLYPELVFNGTVGVGDKTEKFHGSIEYDVGLDASWEIDVWGGLRRGVEAADASIGGAAFARRDVLVSLLGELGQTYVQLRGEQRQLDIARRNIALQERTVELVSIRKRSGLASELEVSQALSLLETTRAALPSIETAIARSIHRLGVLAGKPPTALAADLEMPGPIPERPPFVPVGLSSELLKRRPDIRRAERVMAAATAQIGVAKADLYPKFSLTGTIGYSSQGGLPGNPSFLVGPSVTWPIFSGFKIASNIEVQDARLEQAVLQYRQAILLALEDVENALTAYAKEVVRRQALSRAAKQAEKAASLAQQQYRSGLVDFLNVITAQGTLDAAQQSLVVSEQTLLVDLVTLYKALGGGWEVFEVRLAEKELDPASTDLPK